MQRWWRERKRQRADDAAKRSETLLAQAQMSRLTYLLKHHGPIGDQGGWMRNYQSYKNLDDRAVARKSASLHSRQAEALATGGGGEPNDAVAAVAVASGRVMSPECEAQPHCSSQTPLFGNKKGPVFLSRGCLCNKKGPVFLSASGTPKSRIISHRFFTLGLSSPSSSSSWTFSFFFSLAFFFRWAWLGLFFFGPIAVGPAEARTSRRASG